VKREIRKLGRIEAEQRMRRRFREWRSSVENILGKLKKMKFSLL
jgi:hypothetical protein